jgi:hypothetical protein
MAEKQVFLVVAGDWAFVMLNLDHFNMFSPNVKILNISGVGQNGG